jgi:AbrB family looped-hinge helix DNA binding protein
VRITAKGQVTIPAHIRKEAGLLPGTEVEFIRSRDRVYIRKVAQAGRQTVEALRGTGTVRMTTDEIMALTRGEA